MSVPNEYRQVLQLLDDRTRAGALRWRESGRHGEFVARLRDYSVTLAINPFTELFNAGAGIKSPITCQLLLPEGIEVGRFEVRPEEADYPNVRELFDRAEGTAMKKSDMVREIEAQLRAVVGEPAR